MRSSTDHRSFIAVALAICLFIFANDLSAAPTFTEHGATILASADYDARSASLADIDGDGDLDLFFQGGTGARQLFRNNLIGGGTLTYTNISSMLPSGLGPSWSAAWGDYNGDGRVDVFVGQSNTSTGATGDVLRNNGPAGFSNESVATGLNDPGFHQNVAWADIDNDHDLDLLIGMEGPEKHEIYLQGPAGHFTPVGAAVGFQQPVGEQRLRHGDRRHRRRRRPRRLHLHLPQRQQHPQQLLQEQARTRPARSASSTSPTPTARRT